MQILILSLLKDRLDDAGVFSADDKDVELLHLAGQCKNYMLGFPTGETQLFLFPVTYVWRDSAWLIIAALAQRSMWGQADWQLCAVRAGSAAGYRDIYRYINKLREA